MGCRLSILIKYRSVFFIAKGSHNIEKWHVNITFKEWRQEVATPMTDSSQCMAKNHHNIVK